MKSQSTLRKVLGSRELPIVLYIVVMVVIFSFTVNGFFAMKNFENIMRQITTVGIVSVGMTLVILTAGMDLSVGAILAFAINIGGMGINLGWPIWSCIP